MGVITRVVAGLRNHLGPLLPGRPSRAHGGSLLGPVLYKTTTTEERRRENTVLLHKPWDLKEGSEVARSLPRTTSTYLTPTVCQHSDKDAQAATGICPGEGYN